MNRSWEMYAHLIKDHFFHVGAKRWVELHLIDDPIIPVLVTEDPDGTYYGFIEGRERYKKDNEKPSMIYPKEFLLGMCFPGGISQARECGEVIRLTITQREENSNEQT